MSELHEKITAAFDAEWVGYEWPKHTRPIAFDHFACGYRAALSTQPAAPSPVVPDDAMRDAFEEHLTRNVSGLCTYQTAISQHPNGDYFSEFSQERWIDWQAAWKAADPNLAACAGGGVTQPVLVGDELALFRQTIEDFADCGETETDYAILLDWAQRGLLECTNFRPTAAAHRLLDTKKD